ncbi:unnamed protein product [Parajaminaea phylloscopi]
MIAAGALCLVPVFTIVNRNQSPVMTDTAFPRVGVKDSATMSEWIPPSRPRPVRILCLHGKGQSAASFRALLGPLLGQLPKNYEFHFMDAPYVVAENDFSRVPGDVESEETQMRRSIETCSRIQALEGLHKARLAFDEMTTPVRKQDGATSASSTKVSPASSHDRILEGMHEMERQLRSSAIGKKVLETYRRAGLDECETLLASSGYVAPDRDWIDAVQGNGSSEQEDDFGLSRTLAKLGDYIRMYGPFHGVITGGSSEDTTFLISLLLSELLDSRTHPASALAWPSMFPLLPLNSPAPRAGGWEIMPSMPLPGGRRTAVTQGPFGFVVQVGVSVNGKSGSASEPHVFLEQQLGKWRASTSQGSQPSQGLPSTLSVARAATLQDDAPAFKGATGIADCDPDASILSASVCKYLAAWIRASSITAEEVAGLNPVEARERDSSTAADSREAATSWHSVFRKVEDIPLPSGVRLVRQNCSKL